MKAINDKSPKGKGGKMEVKGGLKPDTEENFKKGGMNYRKGGKVKKK